MRMNYYEILEVSVNASKEVIKNAYRKLTKKYHPDLRSSAYSQERMMKINEAYEVLSDPKKRQMYDQFGTAGVNGNYGSGFGGFNGFNGFNGGTYTYSTGGFGFDDVVDDFVSSIFGGGFGSLRRTRDEAG